MKRILPTISALAASLAAALTLAGVYLAWDLVFIQIGLALIGAAAVFGLLSIAALLAAILSKMTGKI
jgi:hypothetical protein